jgi:hypothetical protein
VIVVLAVLLVALAVIYVVSAVHRPSQRSTPGFVARVNDYTAPKVVEPLRGRDGDVIGWTRKDAA